MSFLSLGLNKFWYRGSLSARILWPLALVYRVIIACRRAYLMHFRQKDFGVPIIVVGNITLGGVGKTPLVIALAQAIQAKGWKIGIVSRGYRGSHKGGPHEVSVDDPSALVGDEALLIAKKVNCPVVIAGRRMQAIEYLLDKYQCEIMLSDDGLQHYSMGRALEIAVVDGERGFGNGLCLPAGPLREPIKRLSECDMLVVNQSGQLNKQCHAIFDKINRPIFSMRLEPGPPTQIKTNESTHWEDLARPLAALAAIGNPQRFFHTLDNLGIEHRAYAFPDHYSFTPQELELSEKTLIMTEKDAVKCQAFARESWYFLPVEAKLSESFWQTLWEQTLFRDISRK